MQASDLGKEEGLEGFVTPTTVALIDCDTVVYAAASVCEYADDKLAKEMYSKEEWTTIVDDPNWDEKESCIWMLDYDRAIQLCHDRIQGMIEATDTGSAELYFTTGKNFRYTVDPMYKANRTSTRYPPGMKGLKEALLKEYPGEICKHIEADDAVVYLKRTNPNKYVLCAVDKDVYKAVAGRHWNYYYSAKYKISPKWITTELHDAKTFAYHQVLEGDTTDNIRGCPGIGPKKAITALANCKTDFERWTVVVKLFEKKNLTVKDAIRDMRLVNMHQVTIDKDNNWLWTPWTPPLPQGE